MRSMKRLISILLLAAAVLSLCAACGGKTVTPDVPQSVPASSVVTPDVPQSAAAEPAPQPADTQPAGTAPATEPAAPSQPALPDGTYSVKFDASGTMFHVNEANKGRGLLTVENGQMTVHISLPSKNILHLFMGTAEDAAKEGAQLLDPTTDTVTYSDGLSEEVFGFDIPVPYLDEPFDCAIVGKKEKWYDHQVVVSDPQPVKVTD